MIDDDKLEGILQKSQTYYRCVKHNIIYGDEECLKPIIKLRTMDLDIPSNVINGLCPLCARKYITNYDELIEKYKEYNNNNI